jgi:hypothetical protein
MTDNKIIQEGKDFLQYVTDARRSFCEVVINQNTFDVQLRTEIDSLLICFDQMKERLEKIIYPF